MMPFIAHKEKNFLKYIQNHFGMVLPKEASLFYVGGVRVGAKGLFKSTVKGEKGYAACDAGFNPTNSFIQNFGHLATKNFINVDEAKAKEFAVGRGLGKMELGPKSGWIVVRYGDYTVGLGFYDANEKKVKNEIPEKRRRKIINSL
jgi:hypothetical protein